MFKEDTADIFSFQPFPKEVFKDYIISKLML